MSEVARKQAGMIVANCSVREIHLWDADLVPKDAGVKAEHLIKAEPVWHHLLPGGCEDAHGIIPELHL